MNEKKLHERTYHRRGTWWSEEVEGVMYAIGEIEYVRDAEGGVWCRNPTTHKYEPVADEGVVRAVAAQVEEDRQIRQARDAHAIALANGDAILADVLRWHMEFTGGRVNRSPEVVDGVAFYQVGRNASHDFFVGVGDGKRYVHSYAECWEDECGKRLREPEVDSRVSEVASWEGCYLGHQ